MQSITEGAGARPWGISKQPFDLTGVRPCKEGEGERERERDRQRTRAREREREKTGRERKSAERARRSAGVPGITEVN